MRIVITGGAGFIGRKLAAELLSANEAVGPDGPAAIDEIVLFDREAAPAFGDARVSAVAGDILDPESVARVVRPGTDSVFHLAAVVSAGAEADFDLGYRVNLQGTLNVLEAARRLGSRPKVLFASSIAVYGGDLPDLVEDETPLRPGLSYGAQKTMGELLVADYSRKGFVDGRAMRLPTVVVRPGKPNKAASGFASGIFREPLNGIDFACPVTPESCMAVISPRRVVACFRHLHDLPAARLGDDRRLLLPGLRVSMAEAVAALERVAGGRRLGRISFEHDPAVQRIVDGWPKETRSARAAALGFRGDEGIDEIVRAYIEDELER